jgi:hypothetical protein
VFGSRTRISDTAQVGESTKFSPKAAKGLELALSSYRAEDFRYLPRNQQIDPKNTFPIQETPAARGPAWTGSVGELKRLFLHHRVDHPTKETCRIRTYTHHASCFYQPTSVIYPPPQEFRAWHSSDFYPPTDSVDTSTHRYSDFDTPVIGFPPSPFSEFRTRVFGTLPTIFAVIDCCSTENSARNNIKP